MTNVTLTQAQANRALRLWGWKLHMTNYWWRGGALGVRKNKIYCGFSIEYVTGVLNHNCTDAGRNAVLNKIIGRQVAS